MFVSLEIHNTDPRYDWIEVSGLADGADAPVVVRDGTEATPESGIANKREAQAAADELKAWLESEGEAPQIIWVA